MINIIISLLLITHSSSLLPLPHPTPTVGALLDPALKAALEGERTSLEKCVSSLEAGNQRLQYELFTLKDGAERSAALVVLAQHEQERIGEVLILFLILLFNLK